jgi:hypothetical protein
MHKPNTTNAIKYILFFQLEGKTQDTSLGILGNNNETSNCIILEEYLGGPISAVKSVIYADSSFNLPGGFPDQQIKIFNNTSPSGEIDVSGAFLDTESQSLLSFSGLIINSSYRNAEMMWNSEEKKWFVMYRTTGVSFINQIM